MRRVIIICMAMLAFAAPIGALVALPALFSDNMVLQQGIEAPVWGTAAAGERVTVVCNKQRRNTTAGADGRWRVTLPPLKVGGPYTMTVRGRNTLTVRNILVGEVWVCSGQSNMAKAVQEAANWEEEAAKADYPRIRILTVTPITTSVPADNVLGQWQVCTPKTAEDFSAAAYYFARNLYLARQVPVGIIQSSYGGSPVESWMPPQTLAQHPELKLAPDPRLPVVDFAHAVALQQQQVKNLMAWGPRDPARLGVTRGWQKPEFDDAGWPTMELPKIWDTNTPSLGEVGGAWFRREITIPAAWAGRDIMLKLGRIAWMDDTYWNGVPVGHLGFDNRTTIVCGDSRRRYRVPGALVKAGRVVIAVRVVNPGYWGSYGGITEPPMNVGPLDDAGQAMSLSGAWRYQIEFTRADNDLNSTVATPPGAVPMYGVSSLYYGMLAPVIPYGIKGVVWYQGESNSWQPYRYRQLLPVMIEGWRAAWGQGNLPFLIVQLPGFLASKPEPSESSWAVLRESQGLTAASVPNCGIISTIDIGDPNDIHPKNKQEVGRRLGLAARVLAYGEPVEYSGPRLELMSVQGAQIRLAFTHAAGMAAREGTLHGFAIAGEDRQFAWANAVIAGEMVVLTSPQVPHPVAVRYAWADNPVCNLINQAGLPAFPFRSDSWHARPVFHDATPDNAHQLRIAFQDIDEDGLQTDRPPTGFLVAGADKIFYPAKTTIIAGLYVLVSSEKVPQPVAVRYAWPGSPVENLGNLRSHSDVPVLPFRSDEWTDATYAK